MAARPLEGREALERLLDISNDRGLLSKKYDLRGRFLSGNFPQALTHLAVGNATLGLSGPLLHAPVPDRPFTPPQRCHPSLR